MAVLTHLIMQDIYGEPRAYELLVEIEKAAGIQPCHSDIDCEARLARALRAQDEQALAIAA
jgi:hypothetical protein